MADWFLKAVYGSPATSLRQHGVSGLITILSISFVPELDDTSFHLDCSGGFSTFSENNSYDPCDLVVDQRGFWSRLQDAAQYMVVLETLCLCYANDKHSPMVFRLYSNCAHVF